MLFKFYLKGLLYIAMGYPHTPTKH